MRDGNVNRLRHSVRIPSKYHKLQDSKIIITIDKTQFIVNGVEEKAPEKTKPEKLSLVSKIYSYKIRGWVNVLLIVWKISQNRKLWSPKKIPKIHIYPVSRQTRKDKIMKNVKVLKEYKSTVGIEHLLPEEIGERRNYFITFNKSMQSTTKTPK